MSNRWPDMFFSDKSLEQAPHRVAKKPAEVPAPKPPSEPTPPPARSKLSKPPAPAGAWPNMFFGAEEAAPPPTAAPNGAATPPTKLTAPVPLEAKSPTAPKEKPKSVDPFDTVAFEQFLDKGKKQQADERKAGASKIELPTKKDKDKDEMEAPAFVPIALPEAPVVPLAADDEAAFQAFQEKPEADEKLPDEPPPLTAEPDVAPETEAPTSLHADLPADVPIFGEATSVEPAEEKPKAETEEVETFNQETIERAKDKGYEPMTLPPMPPGMEPPPMPYDDDAPLPDLPPGEDAFSVAGDAPELPKQAEVPPPAAFQAEVPEDKEEKAIDPVVIEADAAGIAAVVPGLPTEDEPVVPGLPAEEDQAKPVEAKPEAKEVEAVVPGLPAEVPAPLAAAAPAGLESANRLEPLEEGAKKFTLTNGEVITGKVLSENKTELFVQTTTLGVVTLKKDHLAEKLMEVVLLNGDRVTGEVVAENKDFIYIRNASLGTLTIPRDQGAKNVVEAELANGNRIVGELVIETEDIVLIKSATLGTVSVDRKGMKHLAQRVEQSDIKSLL